MASTVNSAFSEFLQNNVNLDPTQTATARRSRDWLREQLNGLHLKHHDFPIPFPEMHVNFGSFARKTKTRPLDDIDIIHCLNAEGSTYLDTGSQVYIYPSNWSRLSGLSHPNDRELNSNRVINALRKRLNEIPNYTADSASRNGEAAVLELISHPWSIDIVPGFFTAPELDGRTYYLIPDGRGHWKKTDPRRDADFAKAANRRHQLNVLEVVRLIKYWNARPTMPSVPPYTLEALVLTHYVQEPAKMNAKTHREIPALLSDVGWSILNPILDPKGIQGDINSLSPEERMSILTRSLDDSSKAKQAQDLEDAGDHKAAIGLWASIFGQDFPKYS
jgi:hypothetical protein